MPNHLPVPPELQHLIEKRENEDPRKTVQRSGEDRRLEDLDSQGGAEPLDDLESLSQADRRSGVERREESDRRKKARRTTD